MKSAPFTLRTASQDWRYKYARGALQSARANLYSANLFSEVGGAKCRQLPPTSLRQLLMNDKDYPVDWLDDPDPNKRKHRLLMAQMTIEELDDFFGPSANQRPSMFKNPGALSALKKARIAREAIDALYRAGCLPAASKDWPGVYRSLYQRNLIPEPLVFLLGYLYPEGPRYVPR